MIHGTTCIRTSNVVADLRSRGLIAQMTSPEVEQAVEKPLTVYAGVDPTAESMHLGNLVVLLSLLHFYVRGHTTIALMGGATGSIGDPSGRSTERQVLTDTVLMRNIHGIQKQIHQFFERGTHLARKRQIGGLLNEQNDTSRLRVLNNNHWFGSMSALEFLGNIGRYARVGTMLSRESVKTRLTSAQGISFTEFSYQLLQAYDFWHLYKHHKCQIQIGGNDQWGNITAGIDFINRMRQLASSNESIIASAEGEDKSSLEAHGVTIPLLTTANGEKFGKSAGNAVWLNEKMTSYFDFYQFFMKVDDIDVERYLKLFTFLDFKEIENIAEEHQLQPDKRYAQRRLADEVTELIHGEHGLKKAQTATSVLFGAPLNNVSALDLIEAFEHDPRLVSLEQSSVINMPIDRLAHTVGACASRSAAIKLLHSGGLYLNNKKITNKADKLSETELLDGRVCVLRTGKSNYRIVVLENK
ncbi:hypothetical protein BDF19DRAFT_471638 [Syncephalis fuscata]|nr:hypothetical protein BDF19DRAFT_471638 [Syncephalis fuscata]